MKRSTKYGKVPGWSQRYATLVAVLGFSLGASSGIVNAADKPAASNLSMSTGTDGGAASAPAVNRYELASQILDRWQPIAVELGQSAVTWREIFATQFGLMDASILNTIGEVKADAGNAAASYARFTQAIRNAGMQAHVLAQSGKGQPKQLGGDVYIPIVPCRLADTRIVGGPISAGTARNFFYYTNTAAFNFGTFQGGAAGTAGSVCPETVFPDNAPQFTAAAITVTVISPTAAGNLVAWGGASPIPTSSVLNWTAGQVLANTTIIPGGGRSGSGPGGAILDFALFYNGPSGSAQFTADVVGYYVANTATALECNQVNSGDVVIPNNSNTSADATCPTGYTLTGGGFYINEGSLGVISDWLWTSFPVSSDTWRTNWSNQTGGNRNGRTYAVCCRIPGR